jgi:cell division protein FtsB
MKQYFANLKPREKAILVVGGISALIIVAYVYFLAPAIDRYATLNRLTDQKRGQYQEMLALQKEYKDLKLRNEDMEKEASRTQKNFAPLSFMEGLSSQARIRDRVVSMKPQFNPIGQNYRESSIEVKAERLSLTQMVSYLHLIENSGMPIRIKSLHIKNRTDDASAADLTVVVSSYEKVK